MADPTPAIDGDVLDAYRAKGLAGHMDFGRRAGDGYFYTLLEQKS